MKKSLGSASGAAAKAVPPQLLAHQWKPGESGNPSGHSGAYGECMRLATEAAPKAIMRLIQLIDSEDERVATVACNSILDRALGKPKEAANPPPDAVSPRVQQAQKRTRAILLAALDAMAHGELVVPEAEPEDGENPI